MDEDFGSWGHEGMGVRAIPRPGSCPHEPELSGMGVRAIRAF